ncbi:MAG: TolC family protein, partial [Pseudomonadota bacterium]
MSARHSIAPPLLVVLLCLAAVAAVAEPVRVAFIQDGPIEQFEEVRDLLIDELFALTRGEFDVEIVTVGGGWTRQGIEQAFADAYADPGIDLVLGFGFATNQIMVSRERFPKPTFLPLVFDATLTNAPGDGVTSGKRNLSYLAERVTFEEELGTYLRIVDFQYAALLVDELILESIPEIRGTIRAAGAALGIRFHLIAHDGVDHDLLARLPGDIDAVIYTGLPRLPGAAFDTLVQGLIERRLPGFSLADQSAVLRGLLASETVETDWRRLARRNALNMQAVLLGEPASAQPVYFEGRQELTINLATARELGLSPRFDVLSEATLVNAEPPAQGPEFTLAEVGRLALEANLDLRAAAIDVETSRSDLRIARSALRPQLSLSGATTRRREAAPGTPALFPDRITDGALTLSQNIYSDDTYANLDISRSLADAAGAGFTAASLDTVRFAGLAFIDVLRARTLLDIRRQDLTLTKSNLDLARDRVRVGTATNADVFRWQSNLANARAAVLRARAGVDQSREALNRVLNRPLDAPFQVGAVAARDPFVVRTETFDELVNSPRTLYWLIDYLVDLALPRPRQFGAPPPAAEQRQREIQRRDPVVVAAARRLAERVGVLGRQRQVRQPEVAAAVHDFARLRID